MIDRASFYLESGVYRRRSSGSTIENRCIPLFSLVPPPHNTILATSAVNLSQEQRELYGMRRLGEDRKGFFDAFKPKGLIKGIVRVILSQGSIIYSAYFSDQLRESMRRDELVSEGTLSQSEAEQQADEWAEAEWPRRWESFPKKVGIAYAKYHAITLVMRIYESFAAKMYDDVMVDKLTIDTVGSTSRREKAGVQMSIRELTSECWFSNLIAYLADYSVHQVILTFGYIMYVREEQRRRRLKRTPESQDAADNLHPGSLILSFTKKSVSLAFSRVVGLSFASVGGGIGGYIWPGLGSLVGINLGDGFAITITDEIISV